MIERHQLEVREDLADYNARGQSAADHQSAGGRDLASQIDSAIEPSTRVVDWQQKDDEQRRMRGAIKKCLREGGYDDQAIIETLAREIVDLAKARTAP